MYIGMLDSSVSYNSIGVVDIPTQLITVTDDDNLISPGKKLTHMSLYLSQRVLHDADFIRQNTITPVLIIFEPTALEKIDNHLVKSVTLDSVYFSSMDFNIDKYWMLGSLQSVVKVLRSADKILSHNIFKTESGHITNNSANYFQLVWFAYRVGLKVYEP